jgi:hypothetical protein
MRYEELRDFDLTSSEGWVAPMVIDPEWCDLAVKQLYAMRDEVVCFLFYRARLFKLVVQAIAENRCTSPSLCCEIICESGQL